MTEISPVVLVTGGSRRIGAAIVQGLHAAGFKVLVHYRHAAAEALEQVASLNDRRPDSAQSLHADLREAPACVALIDQAVARWGRLDALINNASAFYPTPVGSVTPDQWDELVGSNLKAPFFLAQAAAPHLRSAQGAIVNIGDIYGERPLPSYPVYSMTKAGLAALTQSLAVELAPDIRVNGVSPGAILWPEADTNTTGQNAILARVLLARSGTPDDIVRAVRFFLQDAPYVTGQILAVDGGRRLFI